MSQFSWCWPLDDFSVFQLRTKLLANSLKQWNTLEITGSNQIGMIRGSIVMLKRARINKRKNGWTPSASMEIQMTDKDILEKFQSYLKVYNNLIKRNKKASEISLMTEITGFLKMGFIGLRIRRPGVRIPPGVPIISGGCADIVQLLYF